MKRRMHVVSNSHWDREHRHGFQETRIMLADLFDKLVDIMEKDPAFKHYTLDGQMIPFDDYFALKPAMRPRVERLIRDGRILIGPWYSLVDTFSVTPECVVRNLLTGHREAKRLGGEPMKFGYSVFSFGQMAQLPQIYAGFDIHDIIFYKGADKNVLKKSEFIWESPDGTQALTSRLGKYHRVNFFWRFTTPGILGGDPDVGAEWWSGFTNGAKLCHLIDPQFRDWAAIEIDRDIRIRPERLRQGVQDTIECATPDTLVPGSLLFFDGIDFSQPLAEIPEALRLANEQCKDLGVLIMSTPPAYAKALRAGLKGQKLYIHKGDIRMVAVDHVHSESMGANIEIMRALSKAERTLIHAAEPLAAFAGQLGAAYPQEALELAWKYLFQVHAHDSIHGLGDPKIKRDSLYRAEQAQEIANVIARRGMEGLVAHIDTSKAQADDIFVSVYNPGPFARAEVMELQIDLPYNEHPRAWWMETLDGDRLDAWVLDKETINIGMIAPEGRPKPVQLYRWRAHVAVPEIPGFGYRTFCLLRTKADKPASAEIFSSGQFPYAPIGKSARVMDNGVLRVEVEGDGTVTLTDQRTGRVYAGLLEYVDRGCRGDTWVHHAPDHDADISSAGSTTAIAMTSNSGLAATIRIECVMNLPARLTPDRETRLAETIPHTIVTEITLRRASDRLEVKTAFANKARDHFLRVRIPTGVAGDTCWADAPYDVSHRTFRFTDHHGVRGHELARQTMTSFVDKADAQGGLALLSKTAKEFQLDAGDKASVLELSLLRAVNGRFPIDEATFIDYKDDFSHCLGEQTFEYALVPHAGDWQAAGIAQAAFNYLNPMLAVEFGKGRGKGRLPLAGASFLTLAKDNLLFSGIKRSEDGKGWIVRFFNPTGKAATNTLGFLNKPRRVEETRLDETPIKKLTVSPKGTVALNVPKGKILTLAIGF